MHLALGKNSAPLKKRQTAKTVASRKAKGRNAVKEVVFLLRFFGGPTLTEADIYQPVGTVPGPDIHLSEAARRRFPFVIEVKNQEALNIWAALKQAESHVEGHIREDGQRAMLPLLFFKRNRSELYVAMHAARFLEMW
jgi:hypothetical protein